MKVAIAVGTRPEIVKMAPVIRACQDADIAVLRHPHRPALLVRDGRHLLPGARAADAGRPASTSAPARTAYQIATIMSRLEPILRAERPDIVLVEGDTNSVVGVALAAPRRSTSRSATSRPACAPTTGRMPEEMNRILVDHLADVCFAPTTTAAAAPDPRGHRARADRRHRQHGRRRGPAPARPRASASAIPTLLGLELRRVRRSRRSTAPRTPTTGRGCAASSTALAGSAASSACRSSPRSTRGRSHASSSSASRSSRRSGSCRRSATSSSSASRRRPRWCSPTRAGSRRRRARWASRASRCATPPSDPSRSRSAPTSSPAPTRSGSRSSPRRCSAARPTGSIRSVTEAAAPGSWRHSARPVRRTRILPPRWSRFGRSRRGGSGAEPTVRRVT